MAEIVEPRGGRVPFVGLARQHEALAADLRAAYDRVVTASAFTLGEEVSAFESEFAAYCGVARAVGVASGTAALSLALQAAGIGRGDEVVVPAHTFIASALGVIHAGATPVFCDVQLGTGLIDPDAARDAISERTAGVVGVHLYGQVCDMGRLRDLSDRHGLFLLEDAAQAHGATFDGRRAGSLGDAAAFSFYPSKNLGALGDAGAVTTHDAGLAARIAELRHLGQRTKGDHRVVGYNERLDGLQAAFLRAKLPHLDAWNAARRRHAAEYVSRLEGSGIGTLAETSATPCVYHLFPVRVADRDGLAARLDRHGISTGVHYSPAVPRHPAIEGHPGLGTPARAPVADRWAATELSLPMFPELRTDEIEQVASLIVAT